MSDSTLTAARKAEIEEFLYQEAALLDEKRYAEWVDLFMEDAVYWIPANRFDVDPKKHVSIVYDSSQRLRERLGRMEHPYFWAQDPASRLSRIVGNVRLLESLGDGHLVESKFQMLELRRGHSRHFAGTYHHRLTPDPQRGWRIAAKTVYLINNDQPQLNLTFLF